MAMGEPSCMTARVAAQCDGRFLDLCRSVGSLLELSKQSRQEELQCRAPHPDVDYHAFCADTTATFEIHGVAQTAANCRWY